jgi:hypothetical protein
VRTTLVAHITIDSKAWQRVCDRAAMQGRPLPVMLGDLLEIATAEQLPDVPKVDEGYEPPPLARLFLRRHDDLQTYRD